MNTTDLFSSWSKLWSPPERLPLSEWCERNFVLSPEYSARTGPVKLFPFQRELFDSFTNPAVQEIVLCSAVQVTKTLFQQAIIAYVIAETPGPILLVMPKDGDCKSISRERIGPMLRDIPVLRGVTEGTSRTNQDSLLQKDFSGGSLALAGGISPGNLARRSIKILLVDETDKLPESAGKEGSPIHLARERTITYGSQRKIVLTCSPTTESGAIYKAYLETDQRKPYARCPDCGEFQVLEWGNVEFQKEGTDKERADSVYYRCDHCGSHWNNLKRCDACNMLEWRATKPFTGKAGFWISHLYSPFKTLSSLVEDYLAAKHSNNRERLKVFWNCSLALPWREAGSKPEEEVLFGRREEYPHGDDAVIPKGGLFLVAGTDVQPDRLETEIVAFGRGGESWSIAYVVIDALDEHGKRLSVQSPEVWAKLDALLKRKFRHELGGEMQIWNMCIDTGNNPKPVYNFCLAHPQPSFGVGGGMRVRSMGSVTAIKGTPDELKVIASVSAEDAARRRHGVKIVGVGTVAVKTQLFDSLRYIKPDPDTPTPGACHFPDYSLDFFQGLCSEERIVTDTGKTRFEKRDSRRNEVLDCRVYAIAAATICGMDRFREDHWADFESRVLNPIIDILPDRPPVATPKLPPRQRNDWLGTRKDWLR